MDIIIRNINKADVLKIDEFAAQQNKSRNEYIKQHLSMLAQHPEIIESEARYEQLLDLTTQVIKENTQVLKRITEGM